MNDYEAAKHQAAFDRCVDVMCRIIQKYGHQVLEEQAAGEAFAKDDSQDNQSPQFDTGKVESN